MYEINEFEMVSDEELWEEIYGKNIKISIWKCLDAVQDCVWWGE